METKLNGFTLQIFDDEHPPNPRQESHMGTFIAWHRKYRLGDRNEFDTPKEFLNSNESKNAFAMLSVYMLDHSGISVSCSNFNDPWDSGQIGFIYCNKASAEKWLGKDCTAELAKTTLYNEIKTYDNYLNSSYKAFYITDPDNKCIDRCGGFIDDGQRSYIKEMKNCTSVDFHPLFDKFVCQHTKCGEM